MVLKQLIRPVSETMQSCCRNVEVQHSIEDLIELAQTHPRENMDMQLDEQSITSFCGHYSNAMYQVPSAST